MLEQRLVNVLIELIYYFANGGETLSCERESGQWAVGSCESVRHLADETAPDNHRDNNREAANVKRSASCRMKHKRSRKYLLTPSESLLMMNARWPRSSSGAVVKL
jgi:hypothetical protein